jgi:hypothetical protein
MYTEDVGDVLGRMMGAVGGKSPAGGEERAKGGCLGGGHHM